MIGLCNQLAKKVQNRKKSRITLRFVVWTTEWVVVPLTNVGNTEQEGSPLPHSPPTLILAIHVGLQ